MLEPLEHSWVPLNECDLVTGSIPALGDDPAYEDLARGSLRAQPCGHVQCHATVAVLYGDGYAGVDSDADWKWERRIGLTLLQARGLKLDGGADRLNRRCEDGQGFVASELDHSPAAGLDGFPTQVREFLGQHCGGRVPPFARELRVAADVGYPEG